MVQSTHGSSIYYHQVGVACPINSHKAVHNVDPGLERLAQNDYEEWLRHRRESEEADHRIYRLLDPIRTWSDIVGAALGNAKSSMPAYQLRQIADVEVNLDDEGMTNMARIQSEIESNERAESERRAAQDEKSRVRLRA